ncbi:MAG TPA: amino acid adenylation domain-containing protein [Pyrinomonadaceae bacterium]
MKAPAEIKARADRSSARASFAQQRLWFLDQLEPGQVSYNVPRAMRLEGTLNIRALRDTLAEIVQRHEPFRTHFSNVDGELRQIILEELAIPLTEIDLTDLPEVEREAQVSILSKAEAERPFNLNTGPVIRTTLLRLNNRTHVLLLTIHHIVSDAWSTGILLRELKELYEAFSKGRPAALAPLAIQYADFAEWQRAWLQGDELEQQLSYWKQQLGDIPSLSIPTDYVRPASPTFHGACESLTVPGELTDALTALSKREGTTLFMTLLAAFQTLLSRYTGQEDIPVGSPIAGRNRAEIEGLVGFFVNTLTLRTDLSGNPTFKELLQRVKDITVGAYTHQDLPFEKLVEEMDPERDLGRNPLFQVMFQYQEASPALFGTEELKLSWLDNSSHTSKFDLMLAVLTEGESLTCLLQYRTDLFKSETIRSMLGNYKTLLQSIVTNPTAGINTLPLMTASEQTRVLASGLGEVREFPRKSCIHELFEQQVERTPDDTAIIFGSSSLTYRDLNDQANQLAHYLRNRGVGPEVRIAIRAERSAEMIVGLLGILKAGGTYVPLDPSYPEDRTSFIIEDSGASLLLTQARLLESSLASIVPVVSLNLISQEISNHSTTNLSHETTSENAAHVIYTSGSTGRPKGVVSTHRASVNRFAWMWSAYPFGEDEVCCQKTSLSFVDSIWEIFGPLLQGTPLLILDDETVKDPARLVSELFRHRVSRLVLVPSLLRAILESDDDLTERLSHLRYCICSGETLPGDLASAFREKLPHTLLLNLYGSSEVAADVTCYEVGDTSCLSSVPIGKPIANTQIYILDAGLQPAPIGAIGEIYVGGEGLARGYLNQPDLTGEKFVPDLFNPRNGRLFRTGDLGRYLADGNIEYHGRRDHQVKVRGFRIELGEIETAIKSNPAIRQAVAIARDDGRGGKQLVAYLVAEATPPTINEVRSFLRRKLPDYMVPSAFVMLDSLPLNSSGKVDRLALPVPDQNELTPQEEFVAPRTPIEDVLATIWAETLGLDRVGIKDDFFSLGGHSLLVARIVARVREALQIELPMRALFEASTVAALAVEVERLLHTARSATTIPLTRISRTAPLPLSFAQERLWFLDQLEPENAAYNIPRALRLRGTLDKEALQQSFNAIIARHEVLRTSFLNDSGKPALSIDQEAAVQVQHRDLRHLPRAKHEEVSQATAADEARRPFNLAQGPLLRASLLQLDVNDHILLLTIHHIISDGWSIGVLLRELSFFYNAFVAEVKPSLANLPVQYVDFAAWQRQSLTGKFLKGQIEYWRNQLSGAPAVINLPFDRPRESMRSFRGAKLPLRINKAIADNLIALSREMRATLFMTLLTAFQMLLVCITGDKDIVVGAPTVGRNRPEIENLIGYFINTIMLRTKFSNDPDFFEVLRQVREVSLGAFTNQDVPFEKLVEELKPQRTLSHNPLFQVWFVLQNAQAEHHEFRGLTIESLGVESVVTRHDLQLTLWETPEGLEGAFSYSTDLFDAASIAQIERQFQALLTTISAHPETRLSALRAMVAAVEEEYRAELGELLVASSRSKLRSVTRKAVGKTQQAIAEESWTNPTQ